ncbi:MAG: hypothetical protein O2878_01090 [Bacteroidetes bacterium]|nr:hypothetical protein [Bacteroidota bacterium]MDA0935701.1 hypothetical protein [Bacteroidota bacterium]
MGWILKLFDHYVRYSFHVGLAVFALARITVLDFGLSLNFSHQLIFFVAPFLAYNFIKFHRVFLDHLKVKVNGSLMGFTIFIGVLMLGMASCLPVSTRLLLFFTTGLVLLYCLPLPRYQLNFRGLKGMKIHLVALSWVLTTVFLPLSLAGKSLTEFSLVYSFQRYLFVLVATLPFEIRDLASDDPHLLTWPQKWGIPKTRWLGGALLLLFVFLEAYFQLSSQFGLVFGVALLLLAFVLRSKEDQSQYYSSFWVEGIPILWLILKLKI